MDNDNDGRCWFRRLCWLLFFGWLAWLVVAIGKLCRLKARERVCGQTVPPWAYRQPDPLIYSQQYLLSLGLRSRGIIRTFISSHPTRRASRSTRTPQTRHRLQRDRADMERIDDRARRRHAGQRFVLSVRHRHDQKCRWFNHRRSRRQRLGRLSRVRHRAVADAGHAGPLLSASRASVGRRREPREQHGSKQHRCKAARIHLTQPLCFRSIITPASPARFASKPTRTKSPRSSRVQRRASNNVLAIRSNGYGDTIARHGRSPPAGGSTCNQTRCSSHPTTACK